MRHRISDADTKSGAPDPALDPSVLDVMRLLWSVEHRLQSRSKLMEAELGLTGPQRLVLRIGSRSPGRSAGELARPRGDIVAAVAARS